MFTSEGTDLIATVTELRAETKALFDVVEDGGSVLIQRNNSPYGVLISIQAWRNYQRLSAAEDRQD